MLSGVQKTQRTVHTIWQLFNLKSRTVMWLFRGRMLKNYGVTGTKAVELWNHEDVDLIDKDSVFVASHGAKLFKIQ